jgi:predicted RNA binding protein YcfA (HicA-like mRNA interferase family)
MGKTVSTDDAVKALKAQGWTVERDREHVIMSNAAGKTVPIPANRKEIAIGTLKSIERITGVKLR